jgi:integrase
MPFRKMKQKKFSGIYEYYRSSDPKTVVKYYFNARDQDDKPKKFATDAKTPEEAKAKLQQYLADRGFIYTYPRTNPKTDNDALTVKQLSDKFFEKRTTSNNTKDKARFEKYVLCKFADNRVEQIKLRDLVELQQELVSDGLSPASINFTVRLFSQIIKWANEMEYITCNVPKPKPLKVDNNRERVFTDDELELLFTTATGQVKSFLQLLYFTAQRPQSIIDLQVKDVVDGNIAIAGIKKQSKNLIPISEKLAPIIEELIKDKKPNDYLIHGKRAPQMNYDTISRWSMELFNKLFNDGLEYPADRLKWASFYTLRHTALTNVYKNTKDILLAQKIANHSSLATTQRYVKTSDEQKQQAVDCL